MGFGAFLLILASNQMIIRPWVSKISQLVPEEVVVLGTNHLRWGGQAGSKESAWLSYLANVCSLDLVHREGSEVSLSL